MRSRAVRVTLTLLAIVGIGAAAWYCRSLQRQLISIDEQAAAFIQARVAASRHASDLQSSQQAYVAAGQNEAFWFERVTTAGSALRTAIETMEAAAPSGSVRAELAALTTSIDEFIDRDRRVRGYASAGQKLLAADVIFSDSLDASSRIHTSLDRATGMAAAYRAAEQRRLAQTQALAGGGAAVLAIFVMLLLVPTAAPGRREAAGREECRAAEPPADIDALELRPARVTPVASRETRSAPPNEPAIPLNESGAATVLAAEPVASTDQEVAASVDLESIARVCTELARLDDTSAVPSILERMAAALDAPGIVLWVTDADRRELVPIAAHGYPAQVLSRIKALPLSTENATTAAFKTGLLQTVSAEGEMNGAIAAPLVSPSGALGVMSAEMRHAGEKQADRLAACMIVAAQLATIIGPPAARADARSTTAI